jgi:hypothetical protein
MKIFDLSGDWHYSLEDAPDFFCPDYVDSTWPTMHIPQNWFLGGLDHHGVMWFWYDFKYEERPQEPRLHTTLHFDGVDYFADVYLNGIYLGHHSGYFEPFTFDVSQALRNGANILAVRVDSPFEPVGLEGWHMRKRLIKGVLNHHDCRPGGGWEATGQSYNTGGIWNRVYLVEHGAVTFEEILLRADLETQPHILHTEIWVKNRAKSVHSRLEIQCRPENFKGKPFKTQCALELPEGDSHHHIQIPVPDVALWNPWDRGAPNLYQVSAKLGDTEQITSFGFRTVRVDEGFNWYINGKRYFARGSNYLPTQWISEMLFPEVAKSKSHPFGDGPGGDRFKRDVALMKQANLNIIRVHAHVLPPEFHQSCDRAGVMVWQDFPFQWGYANDEAFHKETNRQMRAMVTLLYNHPSIVAWCCHNESPWDAPWMAAEAGGTYDPTQNRELDTRSEKTVLELDPTRYVHRNSGTGDGHTYPGWYFGQWKDYRDLPAAPFVTEYGAQGLSVKESILRTFPQYGPDAGHAELIRFKAWLETQGNYQAILWLKKHLGNRIFRLERNPIFQPLINWLKQWGMKNKGYPYSKIPSRDNTPRELHPAREVWENWRFHDFQPQETFEDGRISPGKCLEEFVNSSQTYQSHLIQYATECYRRNKYSKVTGIFQFDFTDPWPAITWSVLDYWRVPKPAFEALRRAMQPILPIFDFPDDLKAGKAFTARCCAVNDLTRAFPGAKFAWSLHGNGKIIKHGEWLMDMEADTVTTTRKVKMPALEEGAFQFDVMLTSAGGKPLGENHYEIHVE